MKTQNTDAAPAGQRASTPTPWGIEDTGSTLWIGPMRRDNSGKVAEIVFHIDIHGMTENAKADHRADAAQIVRAVNSHDALVRVAVMSKAYFEKHRPPFLGVTDPIWHESSAVLRGKHVVNRAALTPSATKEAP